MSDKKSIFFFMPLASIGGTETVHTDILRVLSDYKPRVFIRYKSNIWKGQKWAKTKQAQDEGKAMVPQWKKIGCKVSFMQPYLEAPRFGRLVRKFYLKNLSRKINKSPNPIVLFWHRESLKDLFPLLEPQVQIIDIVHNNSNPHTPDLNYLLADWAPRLNNRIAVTPSMEQMLLETYKQSGYAETLIKRISIIPHKVQIPETLSQVQTRGKLHVLFVGRDAAEKRFHIILRIAKAFSEEKFPVHFNMAGPSAQQYPEYATLPNITWNGMISSPEKLNHLYAQSDVLLLSSSSEGFPKVIAEAAAYGVVPVSTQVGGIADFIRDGYNGLLIPSINEEQVFMELQQKIRLLQQNDTMLKAMRGNIYNTCRENFSENSFAQKWLDIIENA